MWSFKFEGYHLGEHEATILYVQPDFSSELGKGIWCETVQETINFSI